MWRLESVQLAEASRRVPAGPLVREASAATRPFPKKRLEVVRPSDDAQNESLRVVPCLVPAAACSSRRRRLSGRRRLGSTWGFYCLVPDSE
jgi:hypothetical protein